METFGQYAATRSLREHPAPAAGGAGVGVGVRTIKTWAGVDLVTGMPVLIYTLSGPVPRLPEVYSEHLPALLASGEAAVEGRAGAYVVVATAPGHAPVRFPVVGERLRWLARSSARAVADAHAAGLVHRDLGPEHFYAQGEHLLVDGFGLPWGDEPSPYRAPEGRGRPPADIYAWARSLQALGRNDSSRALDGELGRLVGHCLSARPVERPTAPELVQALEKILAEPDPPPEPAVVETPTADPAPAEPAPAGVEVQMLPVEPKPAVTGLVLPGVAEAALSLQPPPAVADPLPAQTGYVRPATPRPLRRPRPEPRPPVRPAEPERRTELQDVPTAAVSAEPVHLPPTDPAAEEVPAATAPTAEVEPPAVELTAPSPEPSESVLPGSPESGSPESGSVEAREPVPAAGPEAEPGVGELYPDEPAVAIRRPARSGPPAKPKPIRIGWNEDNSWRQVTAPARSGGSRGVRRRAAALVIALAALAALAALVFPRLLGDGPTARGGNPPPAPQAGPAVPTVPTAIIVTFKLRPPEAVGGRLTVLEAPAGSGLEVGQLLATVPGPVSFPAPGRYRLRVSLQGYETTDFEKEVIRDEDVILALK